MVRERLSAFKAFIFVLGADNDIMSKNILGLKQKFKMLAEVKKNQSILSKMSTSKIVSMEKLLMSSSVYTNEVNVINRIIKKLNDMIVVYNTHRVFFYVSYSDKSHHKVTYPEQLTVVNVAENYTDVLGFTYKTLTEFNTVSSTSYDSRFHSTLPTNKQ
jgi:hypothetical protein